MHFCRVVNQRFVRKLASAIQLSITFYSNNPGRQINLSVFSMPDCGVEGVVVKLLIECLFNFLRKLELEVNHHWLWTKADKRQEVKKAYFLCGSFS